MLASFLSSRTAAPLLWRVGIACLVLSFLFLLLPSIDVRLLNGVSVWAKPWKFHVSVGVHLLTLAWAIALLPAAAVKPKSIVRLSWVATACTVLELAYIVFKAAQGEASHFNTGTPLAAAMYALMGVGAVTLTACAAVVGWWVLRSNNFALGRTMQLGIGLGLMLGFLLGTVAGAYLSAQPGHWVGGTLSDAGGLPVVKWSRDGGDLRVAHFFGLHAMQFLPIVGLLLSRLTAQSTASKGIIGFAGIYTLIVITLFFQAIAGQPFF